MIDHILRRLLRADQDQAVIVRRFDRLDRHLRTITERLRNMATQADIDALSTQLTAAVAVFQTEADELVTASDEIKAQIAELSEGNPDLDLTALTEAVSRVTTSSEAIKAAADSVEAIPADDTPPADVPPVDDTPVA